MTTTPEPGDKLQNPGSVVIVNFSESIMHTRQLASAPDRPPTYISFYSTLENGGLTLVLGTVRLYVWFIKLLENST